MASLLTGGLARFLRDFVKPPARGDRRAYRRARPTTRPAASTRVEIASYLQFTESATFAMSITTEVPIARALATILLRGCRALRHLRKRNRQQGRQ